MAGSRGRRLGLAAILCAMLGAAGCDAGSSLPFSARSADGLLTDVELQAVVELGAQRDIEGVLQRLQAERPEVRARAAMALASFQAAESVASLLPALDDTEAQVRRDVAFALGRIGDPASAGALSDALASETDAGYARGSSRRLVTWRPSRRRTCCSGPISNLGKKPTALGLCRFSVACMESAMKA